jgi:hypothetical protein
LEGDASFEECFYCHFVSGIESDWVVPAPLGSLVGEAQARKALKVGLLKVEMAQSGKVKSQG